MGMFTSGWVWFVTDKNGSTGVIPTFGPGTLLVRSRSYMGHRSNFTYDSDLLQFDRGEPLSADDPYASEYQAELLKEYAENVRQGEIEDTDGYLASESSVPPEEAPTAPSQSPISRPPPTRCGSFISHFRAVRLEHPAKPKRPWSSLPAHQQSPRG